MPDREKVIKGIQECDLNGGLIGNCPYKGILALLKEQDEIIQNILREKTNELNNKVTTLQIETQNRETRRLLEQK